MQYYLGTYIGTGTDANPIRPNGTDGILGWSAIDLRPNSTVTTGRCILKLPNGSPNPAGAFSLGTDVLDTVLTNTQTATVNSQLGVSLPNGLTVRQAIRDLLTIWGTGAANGKWNNIVKTAAGMLEIWLGGERIFSQFIPSGGAGPFTESFNEADTVGSWGPNLTWTLVSANTPEVKGNQGTCNTASGNSQMRAEVDASGNDNEASITAAIMELAVNSAVTVKVRHQAAADTSYQLRRVGNTVLGTFTVDIRKIVTGTQTVIAGPTTVARASLTIPELLFFTVSGSTLTGYLDGTQRFQITDTAVTTGTRGGASIGTASASTTRADDFQFGDLGSTTSPSSVLPFRLEAPGLVAPGLQPNAARRSFQPGDDTKPADAGPPPTTGRPPVEAPGLRGPHPQTGRNRPSFIPGDDTKPADHGPSPILPPGLRGPSRQRLQPRTFTPGDDTTTAAKQPPPIIPPARRTPWGRWQPNPLLVQTAPDQFGKAISDYATGSWTVAPLWSKVDEIVPDDSDLITSETLGIAGTTSVADLQLYDMGDPLSSVNHTIWVRAKAAFTLGTSGGIRVELREGNALVNTLIATLTTDALTTSLATYSYTLSGAEADSINSYGDLFLRIYGNFPVGNLGGISVSWVQFQVPYALIVDAIAPAGVATGTGSAPTPAIQVQPNAGNAVGTGIAPDPTAKVQPSAGASTGTGTAYNPSGVVAPNTGVATGTGNAPSPALTVGPSAGTATGTGAVYTPASAIAGTSGVATGSGSAGAPSLTLSPNAGASTGTGTAPTPATSISGASGVATGTGIAGAPSSSLAPQPLTASGIGTAYSPTVVVVSGTTTVTTNDCTLQLESPGALLLESGDIFDLESCGVAQGGGWFSGQRGPGSRILEVLDDDEELLMLV